MRLMASELPMLTMASEQGLAKYESEELMAQRPRPSLVAAVALPTQPLKLKAYQFAALLNAQPLLSL